MGKPVGEADVSIELQKGMEAAEVLPVFKSETAGIFDA